MCGLELRSMIGTAAVRLASGGAMKIMLVRHGIAVEREEFSGEDRERPLTEKGRRRARRAFRGLQRLYPHVDRILTSPAVRAHHTARLLCREYPRAELETTDLLLSGGLDYQALVTLLGNKASDITALVGHEPDLTQLASLLLGAPELPCELSKAGVLVIDVSESGRTLETLLTPRILRRVYG
jgi:phosphohistidine phosphatase